MEEGSSIPENSPKKFSAVRTALKVTGIFLLTILVLLGVAVLTAFLLEDKIKNRIVDEVNAQVTVPIKVEGGITLSLIRHFPYASLTFSKVSIDDRLAPLLDAIHNRPR